MTLVAGVDACRGGWVAIVLDADHFADSCSAATFAQLLDRLKDVRAVGVDIPIGLPARACVQPMSQRARSSGRDAAASFELRHAWR